MARILLSKVWRPRSAQELNGGVVMKSVHAMAPVGRLKLKKQAKLKSVAAANIAQRYLELVRLRGQVHELEARQRSAEYNARSARSRSPLSPSHQPGIV